MKKCGLNYSNHLTFVAEFFNLHFTFDFHLLSPLTHLKAIFTVVDLKYMQTVPMDTRKKPFISANPNYSNDPQIQQFVEFLDDKPFLKKFIYSLLEDQAVNIMGDLNIEICIIKLMRFKARQVIEMSEEQIEQHVADLLWARSGASKAKWDGTVLVGGVRHDS